MIYNRFFLFNNYNRFMLIFTGVFYIATDSLEKFHHLFINAIVRAHNSRPRYASCILDIRPGTHKRTKRTDDVRRWIVAYGVDDAHGLSLTPDRIGGNLAFHILEIAVSNANDRTRSGQFVTASRSGKRIVNGADCAHNTCRIAARKHTRDTDNHKSLFHFAVTVFVWLEMILLWAGVAEAISGAVMTTVPGTDAAAMARPALRLA